MEQGKTTNFCWPVQHSSWSLQTMARDPLIATFEAAMASIPVKSGYAYKRWRKGIDMEELLKKTNMLFEAGFNFTNKSVSNKVATCAEATQGLAEEQFGSHKRHHAIKLSLNKCLTMDLL
jgi:hypothetical protein